MPKEIKTEIAVPLRIILVAPPPGVDFGIQEGKGNDYKTIAIQRSKVGNLVLDCTIKVSLYSVSGSRYKQIIAFIWDNAGRTEQHDLLIQGLCKLDHVVDAVVVSRPSMMVEIDKKPPDADKGSESQKKEDGE
jgi:hypothetical protein